ncbi:S8 family serine peptidase [Haloferula sargassicola]|uniref:Peptidase S8/S53 domain-containing protein n=1 Tax=Haloferula sargassicola TaxID=490096 RepID=A0ABP9UVT1_9BACT
MVAILSPTGISRAAEAYEKSPALVVIDTGICPSEFAQKGAPLHEAFILGKRNELQAEEKAPPAVLIEDVTGSPAAMGDTNGHGTHLCGILWDEQLAWEESPARSLVMLKAGSDKLAAPDLLRAIERIRDLRKRGLRVRVVLCAFNLYPKDCEAGEFQAVADALKGLMDEGVWIVASAGSRGEDLDGLDGDERSLPANLDHPNCLVVAATNDRGLLAARSNFGASTVWLAAAGTRIESLWPHGERKELSGSSQAAAVVAARLFHEATAHPDEDLEAIKTRVEEAADRHPSLLQTTASGRFLKRAAEKTGE